VEESSTFVHCTGYSRRKEIHEGRVEKEENKYEI
jgi:hypothetical protein